MWETIIGTALGIVISSVLMLGAMLLLWGPLTNLITKRIWATMNEPEIASLKYESEKDNITFQTREDAENTLGILLTCVENYGMATVSDLYDLCGVDSTVTDATYGWTDLTGVRVIRVRRGYELALPKAQHLE